MSRKTPSPSRVRARAVQFGTIAVLCLLLVAAPTVPFVDFPAPTGTAAADEVSGFVSDSTAMQYPNRVEVSGDYAYVAGNASDALAVVDISTPSNPTVAHMVSGSSLNAPQSIAISDDGKYAYVGSADADSLTVIDISDPTAATVEGSVSASLIGDLDDLYAVGDRVYGVTGSSQSFVSFDVSDPTNPTIEGSVSDSDRLSDPDGVKVRNGYAFVAADISDRLTVIDLSDHSNLTIAASIESQQYLDGANDIVLRGDYAYLTAPLSNSVTAVDISNPEAPEIVGNATNAELLGGAMTMHMADGADYAYVASRDVDRVVTVDLRNPANPLVLESTKDSTAMDQPFGIGMSDEYAVVTGKQSDSLAVVKVAESISGTVESCPITNPTCDGNTVDGATVEAWGADTENLEIPSGKTVEEAARDYLESMKNPAPSSWDPTISLTGSSGLFETADASVVGVYSKDDIGTPQLSIFPDNADLRNSGLSVPAGEPVMFVAVDPAAKPRGWGPLTNEFDGQLGARHHEDGTITLTSLGPAGDEIDTRTVTINQTLDSGALSGADPSKLHYGKASLSPGFYRVSYEDSSVSYVLRVGSIQEIANVMASGVTNEGGKQIQSAKDIQADLESRTLARMSDTTGPNGEFKIIIHNPTVETVSLQAYKGGQSLNIDETRQPSFSDLVTLAQSAPNTTLYVSNGVNIHDVPSSDVTVSMTELSSIQWMTADGFEERLQDLLEDRLKDAMSDLRTLFNNRMSEMLTEELRTRYASLISIIDSNPALEEHYLELSDRESIASPEDLSREELQTELELIDRTIQEMPTSIDMDPPTIDTGGATISPSFPFAVDLDKDDVTAIVRYSNGSSSVIDDEYVSIEDTVGPGSIVHINEFPLGEADAPVATIDVLVSTENGFGRSKARVKNPTFDGTLPALESIRLSTEHPGPNDVVDIRLNPKTSSSFDAISNVTVYGPNDKLVPTGNITDGRAFEFETNGTGVHKIRMTVLDDGGNEYVEVMRVKAGKTDEPPKPTVRIEESPLGVYPVVSDGLQAGDVTVEETGRSISVSAVVAEGADAPSTLDVFAGGALTAPQTKTKVSIVRGPARASVDSFVDVVVHTPSMSEDGIVYRNDNQPVLVDGGTQFGERHDHSNTTAIATYTDDSGTVTIQTNNAPGYIDKAWWLYHKTFPNGVIGSILSVAPAPDALSSLLPATMAPQSIGVTAA